MADKKSDKASQARKGKVNTSQPKTTPESRSRKANLDGMKSTLADMTQDPEISEALAKILPPHVQRWLKNPEMRDWLLEKWAAEENKLTPEDLADEEI